jgi:hypothetical protein
MSWSTRASHFNASASLDSFNGSRSTLDIKNDDAIAAAGLISPGWHDAIRDLWAKNLDGRLGDGTRLTPQRFAEIFVDANFPF